MQRRDQPGDQPHRQTGQQGDQQIEGHGVELRVPQTGLQQADARAEDGSCQPVPQVAAEEDGEAAAAQHAAPEHH